MAFSILVQARDVCVPGLCHSNKEKQEETTCSKDITGKKSCCQKNHPGDHKNHDEGSCDGDICHCLGCLKVFITSPSFSFDYEENIIQPIKKNTLEPLDSYVFDYTKDFYHPPRILS
ncbi:MAG: hypothetical protein IPF52_08835 [Saprospiraceae bacterium]|nr:hypothetical protein [Saprospiraceae bacterium]